MKKLIFIIFASIGIAIISSAFSAAPKTDTKKAAFEIPDFEQIKKDISDPSSPYYYPKLMARYEQNETVMNLEDYRHLYYGYLFQEDFDPYRHSEFSNKNQELYYRNSHTRAELDSMIHYAEGALNDTPFDLSQMNFLIYALRERGKINKANIWQYRLNHILQAIVSSGTGTSPEQAWFVIDPHHEYNIINFQNAVATDQGYQEPYYDRIEVEKGSGKEKGTYYFNIKNLLEEYYRKHPAE